jgi:hypothetical protein
MSGSIFSGFIARPNRDRHKTMTSRRCLAALTTLLLLFIAPLFAQTPSRGCGQTLAETTYVSCPLPLNIRPVRDFTHKVPKIIFKKMVKDKEHKATYSIVFTSNGTPRVFLKSDKISLGIPLTYKIKLKHKTFGKDEASGKTELLFTAPLRFDTGWNVGTSEEPKLTWAPVTQAWMAEAVMVDFPTLANEKIRKTLKKQLIEFRKEIRQLDNARDRLNEVQYLTQLVSSQTLLARIKVISAHADKITQDLETNQPFLKSVLRCMISENNDTLVSTSLLAEPVPYGIPYDTTSLRFRTALSEQIISNAARKLERQTVLVDTRRGVLITQVESRYSGDNIQLKLTLRSEQIGSSRQENAVITLYATPTPDANGNQVVFQNLTLDPTSKQNAPEWAKVPELFASIRKIFVLNVEQQLQQSVKGMTGNFGGASYQMQIDFELRDLKMTRACVVNQQIVSEGVIYGVLRVQKK